MDHGPLSLGASGIRENDSAVIVLWVEGAAGIGPGSSVQ